MKLGRDQVVKESKEKQKEKKIWNKTSFYIFMHLWNYTYVYKCLKNWDILNTLSASTFSTQHICIYITIPHIFSIFPSLGISNLHSK